MFGNPFPGLRSFEMEETRLFFGRDGQSNELLKRLQESHFLALVGVSGSGKSSLVRAGLLPALDGGLMASVESDWRVAVFRPGNTPIGNMARALITQAGFGGGSGLEDVEVAIAETTLRRGNLGLLELLKQTRRKLRSDGRPFLAAHENVLLVVDQFEEIFRILEQHDELVRVKQLSEGDSDVTPTAGANGVGSHPREEASAFVKLLLDSTEKNKENKYEENLYIIITMRSDYLGETAQFLGMPERINEGQYLIPRMSRDDRRKAIVGPVAVAGGTIAEPLVNQLLNDAGENPGQLPILQHALMRMWDLAGAATVHNGGLNLKHYDQIGKLSGALSQHANEAFNDLSPEHQELAAKVFKCLTEKGLANRETRRPMKLVDICAVVGAAEADVKAVVECFRQDGRWFLMPPRSEKRTLDPDTLIDISHESLISGWDKLSQWVNEEAESARIYKRLADTAILKERGLEDFYRGPALQVALKWKEDNTPNQAWARRYHPEYIKALTFLSDSLDDTQIREKAEKERIAKELRRRATYNIVLGILTLLTVTVGVLAVGAQRRNLKYQEGLAIQESKRAADEARHRAAAEEDKKEAVRLRNIAYQAEAEALRSKRVAELAEQKAVAANTELKKTLAKEQAAVITARKAQAEAIEQRNTAEWLQKENFEQARNYAYFKDAFNHIAARDYVKAISSLQNALAYFEEKQRTAPNDSERQKNIHNSANTLINIADVHASFNDPEQDRLAAEAYYKAIGLIGSSDRELLARTMMKAGSVWKDSKDVVKATRAAEYFDKAAFVYRDLGQKSNSAEAWVEAGKVHLGFKDMQGLTTASVFFGNALKILSGSELASTNADIGESYMKLLADGGESADEDEDSQPAQSANTKDNRLKDRLREEGARYFRDAGKAFEGVPDLKNAATMHAKSAALLSESKDPKLLDEAVKAYESAAALYGRNSNAAEQGSVLVEAGEALFGNSAEAAQTLAPKLLEQAANVDQNNTAQQVATLTRIASIYADLDPPQKERALDYYQRAIVLARSKNDKEAEVTAIFAKAEALENFEEQTDEQQVEQLYTQAAAVYNDDPRKKIDTLVKVGDAVLGMSRSDAKIAQAERFFAPALDLAQKQQDKKLTASTHMAIGVVYGLSRREKAGENYRSALEIYQAEGDLYGEAMAVYRLSGLGGPPALIDRGLALFAQVIPKVEASGTLIERAEAYFAVASLYRRKKEYQTALDNYNRALDIYQKLPDRKSRVNNIRNLIRSTQRLMVSP